MWKRIFTWFRVSFSPFAFASSSSSFLSCFVHFAREYVKMLTWLIKVEFYMALAFFDIFSLLLFNFRSVLLLISVPFFCCRSWNVKSTIPLLTSTFVGISKLFTTQLTYPFVNGLVKCIFRYVTKALEEVAKKAAWYSNANALCRSAMTFHFTIYSIA